MKVNVYAVFGLFMQGLCSVYICLHIHSGNGERRFLPFICSGFWFAAGLLGCCWWAGLVRCCCWWGWFWFSWIWKNHVVSNSGIFPWKQGVFYTFSGFSLLGFRSVWFIYSHTTQNRTVYIPLHTQLHTPTVYTTVKLLPHYHPHNSNYLKINTYKPTTLQLHEYKYIYIFYYSVMHL